MTDGLCMGHPRCAIPPCRDPLSNNRHRFCPTHFHHHYICAVQSCSRPVVPPGKMCENPQHRQMEKLNKARGEASFQFASRMQRIHVSHPADLMLSDVPEAEEHDSDATVVNELEENITWFKSHGEDAENVQIYNEHNPGCIGEDEPHGDDEDTAMGDNMIPMDIDMEGKHLTLVSVV